ncbi:ribosome-associated heat shock protein Hsp15 [Natronospira proteinivora]|uniref:Heat shock protein 15 n=1 Tax=Natronospira proteinivora TaxID=1807133 RepID=A0ABT1G4X6_9GAMM|nr:S4 domain-containing protein [Natronospira proteinivora]MCP1726343.1 ribosome-associated heat shock protein Hsp15 [Natronospira proteinivora]
MSDVRIDKWLWAARFFKTRAMAQKAVAGGKVHVNGHRVKPSHGLKQGDEVRVTKGPVQFDIVVQSLSEKRGPAKVAEGLYEETEASIEARRKQAEIRKMERLARPIPERRPDKKERRQLRKMTGKT